MAIITETPEFSKFRTTLSDLLSAVNEKRSKAEQAYDAIPLRDKISLLMAAFASEGIPPEEAELAAVLLRRLFTTDFEVVSEELSPELHAEIKAQLLQHIQKNIDRNLRRKISDVTAELARNYIDDDGNNQWPEFLVFLFESACSPDSGLKEIALLMFASVPAIFGNQQSKYIDVIHRMLTQSLTDQTSPDVRFAAVKATSSFLLAHDKEIIVQKQFSDCLSLLLQFYEQVGEEPDPRVEDILRSMVELVDKCPQSFRSQVDYLFQLCLKSVSSPNLSESCRHLALEVIVTLAEAAPAMVRKLGSRNIPHLVNAIFKMMTDLEEDPDWDFDEDQTSEESDSNNLVGEAALDRLACALGGKTILPVCLSSLSLMLNSTDWKTRYAGLMTVSAIGEGCHKQMSNILNQIVDGVLPFLMDSNSRVRYAACNALGQMASDFAPVFQKKFGDKVIVGLLQLLGEPSSPRVQAHAGAALVNFFEECPKHILNPHMNNIADSLEAVLSSKMNELAQKGAKMVLEQVVVTLASLADCSEEKFLNYYDKFMPFLKYIIQNAHQPELRLLRGKTIECISLIGLAVGKDKFLNDAGEVMDLLLKSQTDAPLQDDDPQLTYMIAAWARICKILGKGFEPYLPYVMGPVLKAAALKPEIAVLDADDMKVVENDDDWEFINLGEKHANFGVRTAGLDEKATACQMLVCYARELKEAFAPYVEETVKLMVPMLKFYFHDDVRSAAAEILPHLLRAAEVRGKPYVQEMWRFILTPFLQALESEPEAEVLCEEMGAFAECIEVLRSECFSHEDMMFLINFMNKKLIDHFKKATARDAQRKEEDYDEVLEEDLRREDDNDVYILSKISDIICSLFSTYKTEFFPYFDILLPHFIQLLEPNRSWADRQWALCVFADVIEYGGALTSRYQQYFLQPLIESLSSECPDIRQTAAYAMGCLGLYGGPEYRKVCADSVPTLVKMINAPDSRSEDNIKATENAISAIAKFLMCNDPAISLEEIVPVWVSWLPIWEDAEESKFVYNFLCSLLETNNRTLLGNENCNLPHIVKIIAEAFYKEAIEPSSDVGKRVITLLRDIQNNQELFSACIAVLSPYQQEALHAALTNQ